MADHRQSSLLLHALNEPDRRWILARLPARDQRILREHLTELRILGIPADFEIAEAATASPRSARAGRNPLRTATVSQMRAILIDEPVWMLRHLLALDNWSWKQDFIESLQPGQRERVLAGSHATLNPKLAKNLRTQLAGRLATLERVRGGGSRRRFGGHGAIDFVRGALRRWL
jgi:hypothetical protein